MRAAGKLCEVRNERVVVYLAGDMVLPAMTITMMIFLFTIMIEKQIYRDL